MNIISDDEVCEATKMLRELKPVIKKPSDILSEGFFNLVSFCTNLPVWQANIKFFLIRIRFTPGGDTE